MTKKKLIVSQALPHLFQMPIICLFFQTLIKKKVASFILFRCQNQKVGSGQQMHEILPNMSRVNQGSHRLEKYLNLEGFLEKSLKIKSALKSTGKSLKSLEKSLNFKIFCRT